MPNLLAGITSQINAADVVVGVLAIAAVLATIIGVQLALAAALESLKEHMYLRGPGAQFKRRGRRTASGTVPIRIASSRRRRRRARGF
jgi:hypothetical protein